MEKKRGCEKIKGVEKRSVKKTCEKMCEKKCEKSVLKVRKKRECEKKGSAKKKGV